MHYAFWSSVRLSVRQLLFHTTRYLLSGLTGGISMKLAIIHHVSGHSWKGSQRQRLEAKIICRQGRNHGWKVEEDQGLGPNTGRQAPRQRPGWVFGAGGGRPLPLWVSGGHHPRKTFENSDAKSYSLVTTCCEISFFLKTTAKKLGKPIHCWSPT